MLLASLKVHSGPFYTSDEKLIWKFEECINSFLTDPEMIVILDTWKLKETTNES